MRQSTLLLVAVAVMACVGGAFADSAYILASKSILNNYLVENMDITIQYSLFNIGEGAASSIQLLDYFPQEGFNIVAGSTSAKWDHLAAGANVTHLVVVRPLSHGRYNFTFGQVSYLETADASDPVVALTSAPGVQQIYPFNDYDRQYASHILQWAVFAVATAVLVGGPAFLYLGSRAKYVAVAAEEKNRKQR
ncbi:signal sequence receptor beta [Capsaspora owczarzaki ATCC 30864]|uniref:Signal sequence receptor beta n=1 Tax=Capsaspora owczarzaki (strain ATCC 30864) TaxID=595528 RepID=A0A0D2X1Q6_CAPO3|nr:signal sequence receptor beta [Capsaspora owczarzaki ATCC 30864]KJE91224.1 signal sequence receptor beta [Capsaspora owczarzaki ATCC 30864]|eukprot:XP_004349140.1 signal sequence receptor beta [Capsaspora owczarzaki ATCC 30864]